MTSAATAGYKAGLFLAAPASVSMTNEAMTDSGDHTTFNVTNEAHQCWDYTHTFTVQTAPDGSTWSTASPSTYTIHYAIGQVVFNSAVTGGTPSCRISAGYYLPIAFLAGVTSIDGTATGTALDATAMQNPPSPWKTFIPGINGATVKLACLWVNGGTFLSHMTAADLLVLKIYPDSTGTARYQGYGVLTTDGIKSAVNAVNTEDLDFVLNGQLYYVAS